MQQSSISCRHINQSSYLTTSFMQTWTRTKKLALPLMEVDNAQLKFTTKQLAYIIFTKVDKKLSGPYYTYLYRRILVFLLSLVLKKRKYILTLRKFRKLLTFTRKDTKTKYIFIEILCIANVYSFISKTAAEQRGKFSIPRFKNLRFSPKYCFPSKDFFFQFHFSKYLWMILSSNKHKNISVADFNEYLNT